MSPLWHHFWLSNNFLVLANDIHVARAVENEEIKVSTCSSNGKARPGLIWVHNRSSLVKLQRHRIRIEQKDTSPLASSWDLEHQEWMSTSSLHWASGTIVKVIASSLWEDGVVSIIQEKAVSHTLSPAHKSLGLNLKRDVLVSFHKEEVLVLGGQEFLCHFIKSIVGRGSGEVEGWLVDLGSLVLINCHAEQWIHLVMIEVLLELMISKWRIQPFIRHCILILLILTVHLDSQCAIVRSHRSFKSCVVNGLAIS